MRWLNDTALVYTLEDIAILKMIIVGKIVGIEMRQTPSLDLTQWMQGKS